MTRIALVTAVALAVSGMGFIGAGCDRNKTETTEKSTDTRTTPEKAGDTARSAGDKTGNMVQKVGEKIGAATEPSNMSEETKDVNGILADVVDSAYTTDGFNDVVSDLTKADRERIGKVDKGAYADMNTAIRTFQDDWKAKYHQSFAPKSYKAAIYTNQFAVVSPGGMGNATLAGANVTPPPAGSAIPTPEKDMATVTVLGETGMGKKTLQMVNEGTVSSSWRIQLADTVNATRLKDALLNQITKVNNDKANWPTDVNDAYRLVSRHVLTALADAGK